MRYSKDDFQCNISRWERIVANFPRDNPISYLELGVYEGRSLFWLIHHLFSSGQDRAIAVDRFYNAARETFFANLEECPRKSQIRVMESDFRSALIQLHVEQQKFDFIYEDGTHVSSETMETLCLAWPLLKPGGILVVDDYEWNKNLPTEFTNSYAIDSFLKMNRQEIEVIEKNHQVVVKKLGSNRHNLDSLEIGNWIYHWYEGVLHHVKAGRDLRLNPIEKKAVEKIFAQSKWESTKDRKEFEKRALENRELKSFLTEKEKSILTN